MKLRMKVFLSRWFYTSRFDRQLKILLFLIPILFLMCPVVHGMAADCALEPTGENYIGIRYKALLVEMNYRRAVGFCYLVVMVLQ